MANIYSHKKRDRSYRKIYTEHYGSIPKDEDGRTYDIHHIDGNPENNDITNLIAVSIQEHYDIHYSQGDYFAAWKIAGAMQMSSKKQSELARLHATKMVASGKHNLLKRADGTSVASDKVANGTHHLLGGQIQRKNNKKRIKEGTHNYLIKGKGSPHYDYRTFSFFNKDGRTFTGTQNDFRNLYTEVKPGHLSRLLLGNLKSTKGWILLPL